MAEELTIGLDIGGSKMAFVVADRAGNALQSKTLPTQSGDSFNDTLDRISAVLNAYIADYAPIAGIGIGVPGPVDSERGVALLAANLGWKDAPLRAALQKRLARPLPIYIENDVNAAAIGEGRYGVAKGVGNYVFLMVGTGIGGAVLLNGGLLRGATHSEMEIGHISLDPVNGRLCGCGRRGCLEMSVSGKGIIAHAQQHIADYPNTNLRADSISTHEIIAAARRDDPLARHVMLEAARALGIACAWCVNLFNPGLIVLGGGLMRACYPLLEAETLNTLRARSLPLNYEAVALKLSALSDGALGAAALVWHHIDEERRA